MPQAESGAFFGQHLAQYTLSFRKVFGPECFLFNNTKEVSLTSDFGFLIYKISSDNTAEPISKSFCETDRAIRVTGI